MQKFLATVSVIAYTTAQVLPPAAPAALGAVEPDANNCPCNRSCKFSGCGGCCNQGGNSDSGFFNKAMGAAGCAAGVGGGNCIEIAATPLQHNLHEHSYCHLDTTPKYARKTVWKEVPVQGTRPVLVDQKKMMRKTVIDYKLVEVPSIKHGTRMVQRTKTRTVPGEKKITSMEEFTVKVQKPVTKMESEEYQTFVTQYNTAERQVEKVRMVQKTVDTDVVEYDEESVEVDTPSWTTKEFMVNVRVPKPDSAPLNKDASGGDGGSCSCFKSQCACQGQADCGCCYPTCGCAPSSEKEYETVQVLTETTEEVVNKSTVVSKIPKIVSRQTVIEVPETYSVTETFQVPVLVEVTQTRQVPTIVFEDVDEIRSRPVVKNVAFDQVETYYVDEEVPFSEPVTTQVNVPFTKEAEIEVIEKIAQQQSYRLVLKTPETAIEKLPPSIVCHEHKYSHSHALSPGETHSHSEEHQHPHSGDGSDFEGRIIELTPVDDVMAMP